MFICGTRSLVFIMESTISHLALHDKVSSDAESVSSNNLKDDKKVAPSISTSVLGNYAKFIIFSGRCIYFSFSPDTSAYSSTGTPSDPSSRKLLDVVVGKASISTEEKIEKPKKTTPLNILKKSPHVASQYSSFRQNV